MKKRVIIEKTPNKSTSKRVIIEGLPKAQMGMQFDAQKDLAEKFDKTKEKFNRNYNWQNQLSGIYSGNNQGSGIYENSYMNPNINLINPPSLPQGTLFGANQYSPQFQSSLQNTVQATANFAQDSNNPNAIPALASSLADTTMKGFKTGFQNLATNRTNARNQKRFNELARMSKQSLYEDPTPGNERFDQYGALSMAYGGSTFANSLSTSKSDPNADFIAEKNEYLIHNGLLSKLDMGGSHASGNDTAINLSKASEGGMQQSPSKVLSNTPKLRLLNYKNKQLTPAKFAEQLTIDTLGKTPDQINNQFINFNKKADKLGKFNIDNISNTSNELTLNLLKRKADAAKEIGELAYNYQELAKRDLGMDNDIDNMAKYGGFLPKAQLGGNQLSKAAQTQLDNPNIRSMDYINGSYNTYMKTGDTNALNDYNAMIEANNYLLRQDSMKNVNRVNEINNLKNSSNWLDKGYGYVRDIFGFKNGGMLPMAQNGVLLNNPTPYNPNYFESTGINKKGEEITSPSFVATKQEVTPIQEDVSWLFKPQTFKTPQGIITPQGVNLNTPPTTKYQQRDWEELARDKGILGKGEHFKNFGDYQKFSYEESLKTPEGQEAIRNMWTTHGVTNKAESKYQDIQKKIEKGEKLNYEDLVKLKDNYIDFLRGKRDIMRVYPEETPVEDKTKTFEENKKEKQTDTILPQGQFNYNKREKPMNLDFTGFNVPFGPSNYALEPVALDVMRPQYVSPRYLDIQPQLNEITRGTRALMRGMPSSTSVDIARAFQAENNAYNARQPIYGQKYSYDQQQDLAAEQANARAKMESDLRNIGFRQTYNDIIAREKGLRDTQIRTDREAALENLMKEKSYNLSKDYINRVFLPSDTGNPVFANASSFTPSDLEFLNSDEYKKAYQTYSEKRKYGGLIKKIKPKIKK